MDWSVIASISSFITSFSVLLVIIQIKKNSDTQNTSSFFYLHNFLSSEALMVARKEVRTVLYGKPYEEWTEEDKSNANRVCASYDQAGILLNYGIIDNKTKKLFLLSSWGKSILHQYEALAQFLDDRQSPACACCINKKPTCEKPKCTGRAFFEHFTRLYEEVIKLRNEKQKNQSIIKAIRSGGQSGADRGALDAAKSMGIPIVGWCPKDGWAEDYPEPPGLLKHYPELKETPSKDVEQRTEWNVRDSDATLIIVNEKEVISPGTMLTEKIAKELGKSVLIACVGDIAKIANWLNAFKQEITLNVAGPRESEDKGIYKKTYALVSKILLMTRP